MTYSSIIYGLLTRIEQQKVQTSNCLYISQMPNQCLVSQFCTN